MNMFILFSARDQFRKQNAEGAGIDHRTVLASHTHRYSMSKVYGKSTERYAVGHTQRNIYISIMYIDMIPIVRGQESMIRCVCVCVRA